MTVFVIFLAFVGMVCINVPIAVALAVASIMGLLANEGVDSLLAEANGNPLHASKAGRVIVAGDLNTMEFTDEMTDTLPGTGADRVLTNLVDGVDDDNVYTFNFEGNSQVLDHMFVTDNLLAGAEFDIVHVNVDYPRVDSSVGSDHEPLVGRFRVNG